MRWNGVTASLDEEAVAPPLCSSSFDDQGSSHARTRLYTELSARHGLDLHGRHLRFHQSHLPERGPYSVCMHRPDAATVSFTLVMVESTSVTMVYADGPPCATPLEHLVTLDRAEVGS